MSEVKGAEKSAAEIYVTALLVLQFQQKETWEWVERTAFATIKRESDLGVQIEQQLKLKRGGR